MFLGWGIKSNPNGRNVAMINKLTSLFSIMVLAVASLGLTANAMANTPWKWEKSLRVLPDKDRSPMRMPSDVFVDVERERYYVADTGNSSLHSFNKNGQYLNSFKPGNQLTGPFSLTRDEKGAFWTSEKPRNSLTKIDIKGKEISPHQLAHKGDEVFPDKVAIYKDLFYVLDKKSGTVIVFDREFKAKKTFDCGECKSGLVDFEINNGSLWALGMREKKVYVFNLDGSRKDVFSIEDHVVSPNALTIGPSGAVYVLDRHAGSISVFEASGLFKYKFLSKGHNKGQLYYPEELLFDAWGRLCVVDSGNGRIEIFSR